MMSFRLSSLALVFSLLLPAQAWACPKLENATLEDTCVVGVTWQGLPGTWFHHSAMPELRRKLLLAEQYEPLVNKLNFTLTLSERETASLRSAVEKLKASNKHLQEQAEKSGQDAREARAELAGERRWYKSPLFWGIVMFVAGAAIQNACCSGK